MWENTDGGAVDKSADDSETRASRGGDGTVGEDSCWIGGEEEGDCGSATGVVARSAWRFVVEFVRSVVLFCWRSSCCCWVCC